MAIKKAGKLRAFVCCKSRQYCICICSPFLIIQPMTDTLLRPVPAPLTIPLSACCHDMSERCAVVTQDAIYSATVIVGGEAGARIDSRLYDRLVRHKAARSDRSAPVGRECGQRGRTAETAPNHVPTATHTAAGPGTGSPERLLALLCYLFLTGPVASVDGDARAAPRNFPPQSADDVGSRFLGIKNGMSGVTVCRWLLPPVA